VTYIQRLDAAWLDHLAPRAPDAPTVISTFSGIGGSSLGYSMAGYRELLAVEWEADPVEVFRLNFPGVPVHHGDIALLSVEDALRLAGIAPGELDVLDGSPPCQGFSTAGHREMSDDRNQLFHEFTRLLAGLQPRAFVMENVSGMVKGRMRLIFVDILRELKACGYRVSARLLDAQYFGVPQVRQRIIFIGVREDIPAQPTHPPIVGRPVTVREAWAGIEDDPGDPVTGPAALLAPYVRPGTGNGGGKYSLPIRGTTAGFGMYRLSWQRPSSTIGKVTILSTPIMHPDKNERISIRQAQRLSSFPDGFILQGTFNERWAGLGNSVPPLFMRAIASHIRETILSSHPRGPGGTTIGALRGLPLASPGPRERE